MGKKIPVIEFVRNGRNSIDIFFDFHEIPATDANLKPLRKKILKKSGSRLFLSTLFASYGILALKENVAIAADPNGLTIDKAQRLIEKELLSMV